MLADIAEQKWGGRKKVLLEAVAFFKRSVKMVPLRERDVP
jgi:hypothetical protein